jgi:hypothetical protein
VNNCPKFSPFSGEVELMVAPPSNWADSLIELNQPPSEPGDAGLPVSGASAGGGICAKAGVAIAAARKEAASQNL